MVIVIHQAKSTSAAMEYNEKKLKEGQASLYFSQNTKLLDPSYYSFKKRMQTILSVEANNTRCKNKCLHISINPTSQDMRNIGGANLKLELEKLMQDLGYGHQPYYVYQHEDIDRMHFHIVSTRIDCITGKKINDSNEKRKVNSFIKELEQKYNLEKIKTKESNLLLTDKSKDVKASIQRVLSLLNDSAISNQKEYGDILRAFNIAIKKNENGAVVTILGDNGEIVRHPINLSGFQQGTFSHAIIKKEPQQSPIRNQVKSVFKELFKEYRFFTIVKAKEVFLMHDLMLYKRSENGNYNIFSIKEKRVVEAQFEIKKYFVRLRDFNLSNDMFFQLAKESILTNGKEVEWSSLEINTVFNSLSLHQREEVRKALNQYLKYKKEQQKENFSQGIESNNKQHSNITMQRFIYDIMKELDYQIRREERKNSKRQISKKKKMRK